MKVKHIGNKQQKILQRDQSQNQRSSSDLYLLIGYSNKYMAIRIVEIMP